MDHLRLAALLCSRLCHDVISPVGAVNNGVEMLTEESDRETKAQALDLLAYSAGEAVHRLQFFRMALGLPGGGGKADLRQARSVAEGLVGNGRVALEWPDSQLAPPGMDADVQKIVLNLILLGIEALPRGGTAALSFAAEEEGLRATIRATGRRPGLNEAFQAALALALPEEELDARTVQPCYTALLAKARGGRVAYAVLSEETVEISAVLPAAR